MEKLLFNEEQARERLGNIGHSLFWRLISTGELESVSIGRRRLVPADALEHFVAKRREAAAEGASGR